MKPNIFLNDVRRHFIAHSRHKTPILPKFATPQLLLHSRKLSPYLLGADRFKQLPPPGLSSISEGMRGKDGHDPCQSPVQRFQTHDARQPQKICLACDHGWRHQAPNSDTWARLALPTQPFAHGFEVSAVDAAARRRLRGAEAPIPVALHDHGAVIRDGDVPADGPSEREGFRGA